MKSQTLSRPTTDSVVPAGSCKGTEVTGVRAGSAPKRIRVLLADDHPIVRRGIMACLAQSPNLDVVGEAADGLEALRKTRELLPDVLLTDIEMPGMTGLAVTEAVHRDLPRVKVLILSMYTSPECMVRCTQAGASGYVLKQAPSDEFVQAVETVNAGKHFFSPDLARAAVNQMVRGNGGSPDLADLSNREREVLVQIAEGLCNKEIACRLSIGTRTVETHRERLMRKLGIHSIAGLTRFAVANGLIAMPELTAA